MSDIHILAGDGKNHWAAIFHFAVPDANNSVGVNYRTALVNSALGGSTQMVEGTGAGQISTAEKGLVEAGELYEHSVSILAESGGTQAAELQSMIRAQYTREMAGIIAGLQVRLKYYGHVESEV